MKKKVIIFSLTYYPNLIGGDVVAVKEITDRLPEYEFYLLTLRFDSKIPKEEKMGNVYVYRLGFSKNIKDISLSYNFPLHYNKYLFPFISAFKAFSLSFKHDFSFSWSMMANYAGFGALFFKFLRPKIPFLLTLQEGDPIDYIKKRVGVLLPLFKMIFKKADKIQSISNYLAVFGRDMGFGGDIAVIPNGVDLEKFKFNIFWIKNRNK
jgi:glycosyltransferase involved in cell wall biosynthesis